MDLRNPTNTYLSLNSVPFNTFFLAGFAAATLLELHLLVLCSYFHLRIQYATILQMDKSIFDIQVISTFALLSCYKYTKFHSLDDEADLRTPIPFEYSPSIAILLDLRSLLSYFHPVFRNFHSRRKSNIFQIFCICLVSTYTCDTCTK